jgi:hypothetical protein
VSCLGRYRSVRIRASTQRICWSSEGGGLRRFAAQAAVARQIRSEARCGGRGRGRYAELGTRASHVDFSFDWTCHPFIFQSLSPFCLSGLEFGCMLCAAPCSVHCSIAIDQIRQPSSELPSHTHHIRCSRDNVAACRLERGDLNDYVDGHQEVTYRPLDWS